MTSGNSSSRGQEVKCPRKHKPEEVWEVLIQDHTGHNSTEKFQAAHPSHMAASWVLGVTSTRNAIAGAGPSWVLPAWYTNIMQADQTKLAQQVNDRREEIHKTNAQKKCSGQQPGPLSLAVTEWSNVWKEEICPRPNLPLLLLDNLESARAVSSSQRTPTVHTSFAAISRWSLLLLPQEQITLCSNLRRSLPHNEFSEDVSSSTYNQGHTLQGTRVSLQENSKRH